MADLGGATKCAPSHTSDDDRLTGSTDEFVRILNSPQYIVGRGLPAYPDLLKDLVGRRDFDDNDASPRTFEPHMEHWQEFDVLLNILWEYGDGRKLGYVKMKIPTYAHRWLEGQLHPAD